MNNKCWFFCLKEELKNKIPLNGRFISNESKNNFEQFKLKQFV